MKINLSFLIMVFIVLTCFGVSEIGHAENLNSGVENDANYALSCDSYASCVELGLKERRAGKESVLLYLSESVKDARYNIYDNISIRLSSNTCPPQVNVYKRLNNVNYLMDVFIGNRINGCVQYYSNITGDERNRDAVIRQLEITYCNVDELFDSCKQGVVYTRSNDFNYSKGKNFDNVNNQFINQGATQNNATMPINQGSINSGDNNQMVPQN